MAAYSCCAILKAIVDAKSSAVCKSLNTGSVAYRGSAQAVLNDDSLITPYLGVFHEGGHA